MQDPDAIVNEALALFSGIDHADQLEQAKARYLGKSGALTELLKGLGRLPPQERPAMGSRINAAAREHGLSYSLFMNGLKKAAIAVDRKVLADIAVFDKPAFGKFVEKAKASLGV